MNRWRWRCRPVAINRVSVLFRSSGRAWNTEPRIRCERCKLMERFLSATASFALGKRFAVTTWRCVPQLRTEFTRFTLLVIESRRLTCMNQSNRLRIFCLITLFGDQPNDDNVLPMSVDTCYLCLRYVHPVGEGI